MAINRQRYTVDQIQGPLPRPNQAGRIRYVYRITFTLGERHVGTVEVPAEDFGKAAAAAAIEAEVQRISDIYALGS
jgi:hypothetical protein